MSIPAVTDLRSHAVLPYRADIDGLRAIAVLAVVAFHAFPQRFPGGFVGVDIFFVISGFLISNIIFSGLENNRFSFLDFYQRRIRRIFPALLLVLTTTYVMAWCIMPTNQYVLVGKNIAAAAFFVANFFSWRHIGYFDTDTIFQPLLHLWSLSVEEQFYLIWPLLVFLFWKKKYSYLIPIALVGTLSFLSNVLRVDSEPTWVFYLPVARLWELLCGSLLAALHYKSSGNVANNGERGIQVSDAKVCLGLVLLAAAIWGLDKNNAFPGWWAIVPIAGSMLVIWAGPEARLSRRLLSQPIMVWFGKISYPLYLWHWPLLSFAAVIEGDVPRRSYRILAVLISILLAWLSFLLVERPVRSKEGKKTVIALLGLMLLLFVVGILGSKIPNFQGPQTQLQIDLTKPYASEDIYRYKTCFLDTHSQDAFSFSSKCIQRSKSGSANEPLIFIWGDSHAAHLYQGFRSKQERYGFSLAQYSSTSCPPLIGGEIENNGACPAISKDIQARIKSLQPQIVVLGSRWSRDEQNFESKLNATIDFLQQAGVQKIVFFGPPPSWAGGLKEILLKKMKVRNAVPVRLFPPADAQASVAAIDRRMADVSKRRNVLYVSLINELCTEEGCLTRVGDVFPDDLITFDSDHFTAAASQYVVDKVISKIISQ